MNKVIPERGVPKGFSLNVVPVQRMSQTLGDYLDERVSDRARPAPQHVPIPPPVVAKTEMPAAPVPSKPPRAKRARFTEFVPFRMQINMRKETMDKIDDLLRLIQATGKQKNTKASEMFDALVEALFDAKRHLDLSEVPARGQWGKESAKLYRLQLKDAFARAIAKRTAS